MKNIKDICFVIQARLSSERTPGKMMKTFAGSSLVEIVCQKINKSKVIPKKNFYFSAYEKEIIDIKTDDIKYLNKILGILMFSL